MRLRTAVVFIWCSVVSDHVVADFACATSECIEAGRIPDLPEDVATFVSERDGCDHFRGEPVPEGHDPESKDRREFIIGNINELCIGTDKKLHELREKYSNDQELFELLRRYEDRLESAE